MELHELCDKKVTGIHFNFYSDITDFMLPSSLEISFDFFENGGGLYLVSPAVIIFSEVRAYKINLDVGQVKDLQSISNDALFIENVEKLEENHLNKFMITFIDHIGFIEVYADSIAIKKLASEPTFVPNVCYLTKEAREKILAKNNSGF